MRRRSSRYASPGMRRSITSSRASAARRVSARPIRAPSSRTSYEVPCARSRRVRKGPPGVELRHDCALASRQRRVARAGGSRAEAVVVAAGAASRSSPPPHRHEQEGCRPAARLLIDAAPRPPAACGRTAASDPAARASAPRHSEACCRRRRRGAPAPATGSRPRSPSVRAARDRSRQTGGHAGLHVLEHVVDHHELELIAGTAAPARVRLGVSASGTRLRASSIAGSHVHAPRPPRSEPRRQPAQEPRPAAPRRGSGRARHRQPLARRVPRTCDEDGRPSVDLARVEATSPPRAIGEAPPRVDNAAYAFG